jgi:iron(II)-dependent oxidoreductase
MAQASRKAELDRKLTETRNRTLWMLDQVPDDYLRVRVHSFYSPIGWHFGHVGRTEEYWVCAATGADPCDEGLSFLYADLEDNPKDNRVNIPDRAGTLDYLARTREFVREELLRADLDSDNPFLTDGYAWEFAIQHECQHQETIAEMMQLIQKQRPARGVALFPWQAGIKPEMIDVPGGSFIMGDADIHGYDNEKDPHRVEVAPFRIARHPVTSHQWTEFMDDGGYDRPELWTEEGWLWKLSENAAAPEYWVGPKDYRYFGPFGARAIHPDEPVNCVSLHEAEAYARWAGKRLPTEAEWEYVASAGPGSTKRRFAWGDREPNHERACFALDNWAPAPVGSHPEGVSPLGIHDLSGNTWEWTASPFLPYPGFRAFPYDGYSKAHMLGKHFGCRGGSWATSSVILRSTFRNWYVPTYRQGFLGLRLAEG